MSNKKTSQFVSQPSFCYITPVSYLDQYASQSPTHLVLAHLVDSNPLYASFYKVRAEVYNEFVMMDNSAYELKEPYAPEKLINLAAMCGASVVVLPDYPFQPSAVTVNAANKFTPLFKAAGLKTFFAPQSTAGNLEDWIQGYNWAANNPDIDIIGMSILGIPNALSNIDPSYARVVMTQLLIDRGGFAYDKHHHYLGLNAGPALEIPSLLRMQALDTIDSSGPVWTAVLGHEYNISSDSLLSVSKPTMPVDFEIHRSKDKATHARIQRNIDLTQALFNGNNTVKTWYAQE